MNPIPFKALTIAGSDTSGGAGLEADLKTFQEHGVYGMVALTCIVAQNPDADWRHDVHPVELDIVEAQLDTVLKGIGVHAVKTGMLATCELISRIVSTIQKYNVPNLVVDPVMACKGASAPLHPEVADALRDELMPLSTVITPNLYEAGILSGMGPLSTVEDMEEAARRLCKAGARTVLVKGGSKLAGTTRAIDVVCTGNAVQHLESDLVPNAYTHGAGCTISAAIAANLAKGMPVAQAIEKAKIFETAAIRASFPLNRWVGTLRHDAWRSPVGG
ncbi:MAG: bifunctional hydroxymethylpyrimidine kinase/phosphomethylpyrimidine kinase [Kiritimatiellia bacterium]|jgi:pyridoxine kinase